MRNRGAYFSFSEGLWTETSYNTPSRDDQLPRSCHRCRTVQQLYNMVDTLKSACSACKHHSTGSVLASASAAATFKSSPWRRKSARRLSRLAAFCVVSRDLRCLRRAALDGTHRRHFFLSPSSCLVLRRRQLGRQPVVLSALDGRCRGSGQISDATCGRHRSAIPFCVFRPVSQHICIGDILRYSVTAIVPGDIHYQAEYHAEQRSASSSTRSCRRPDCNRLQQANYGAMSSTTFCDIRLFRPRPHAASSAATVAAVRLCRLPSGR